MNKLRRQSRQGVLGISLQVEPGDTVGGTVHRRSIDDNGDASVPGNISNPPVKKAGSDDEFVPVIGRTRGWDAVRWRTQVGLALILGA